MPLFPDHYGEDFCSMNVLQGLILGLIQGLGEFLPISSSGHLLLARFFLGIQNSSADMQASLKVFDILLHVGTLVPVIIVFWKDWMNMLFHPVKNRTLLYLIIASLPTLVVYLAAKKLFPSVNGFSVFDSGWFLGAAFLITALFLLVCDILSSRPRKKSKNMNVIAAIVMGFFQGVGLIPGVSRSGSTILGGVFLHDERTGNPGLSSDGRKRCPGSRVFLLCGHLSDCRRHYCRGCFRFPGYPLYAENHIKYQSELVCALPRFDRDRLSPCAIGRILPFPCLRPACGSRCCLNSASFAMPVYAVNCFAHRIPFFVFIKEGKEA